MLFWVDVFEKILCWVGLRIYIVNRLEPGNGKGNWGSFTSKAVPYFMLTSDKRTPMCNCDRQRKNHRRY
uniref:Uncharacterized protein n=1 Tax=Caenorhabditis japonica TaxID=281687 RepID=A0A8R1IAI3_CAEJA